jgi:thioredoxin reductase (NADPH)
MWPPCGASGQEETLAAGEKLFRTGDVQDRFIYLLEGEVAALDPVTGQRYGDATLGPGQFFGEISFLWGGAMMLGAETLQDTRLLSVDARRCST